MAKFSKKRNNVKRNSKRRTRYNKKGGDETRAALIESQPEVMSLLRTIYAKEGTRRALLQELDKEVKCGVQDQSNLNEIKEMSEWKTLAKKYKSLHDRTQHASFITYITNKVCDDKTGHNRKMVEAVRAYIPRSLFTGTHVEAHARKLLYLGTLEGGGLVAGGGGGMFGQSKPKTLTPGSTAADAAAAAVREYNSLLAVKKGERVTPSGGRKTRRNRRRKQRKNRKTRRNRNKKSRR